MANSLFAEFLIPQDVYDRVQDVHQNITERVGTLLDCIEAKIEAIPSDFRKVIKTMASEHFLRAVVDELIHSYCK